ncbi:MAG: hypothetical protein ACON4O_09505 [Lentimonas sp.]
MAEKQSVDTLQAFRDAAVRAGMCPAAALLEPDAFSGASFAVGGSVGGRAEVKSGSVWRLPRRQILECVCDGASVGGHSFLESLIRAPWESGIFSVLVDAANAFDPASLDADLTARLLWVRVADTRQLVHALDLLLRDDNFALVAADMRGMSACALQSIQSFEWYRLQRLAHQRAGGCVVFSDAPCVRCADQRTLLASRRVIDDLDRTRQDLLATLEDSICYQNRGQVLRRDAAIVG